MFKVDFYDDEGNLDHNATVRSMEELNELAQGRWIIITGKAEISHDEAMEVINEYGQTIGSPGLLETLQDMKDHHERGLLSHRSMHAFDTIFGGLQRLFHGDEA